MKLLDRMPDVEDVAFHRELNNLTKLKHNNIVQFVGFCYNEEMVPTEHNGKTIAAIKKHRVLCFEYMHKGSLRNFLSGTVISFTCTN